MASPQSFRRLPRLSVALIGINLLGLVIAVAFAGGVLNTYASSYRDAVQHEALLRGGNALRLTFSRAVEREWSSLQAVATVLRPGDTLGMRKFVDAVPLAGGRVAWVGVADLGGHVVAGSGHEREGEDVSQARWFRQGLAGGAAGSIFASDTQSSGAQDYVNLSAPIGDVDGQPLGVIVYRLRMSALTSYLQEAAHELDLDAMILDRGGKVVASALSHSDVLPSASELRSVELGQDRGRTSADGKLVYASIRQLTGSNVPDFGWSLLVRAPNELPASMGNKVFWSTLAMIGALTAGLSLVALFAQRVFVAPITELARCADALQQGEQIYPPEHMQTREAARLSTALAVLQTRLESKKREIERLRRRAERQPEIYVAHAQTEVPHPHAA